MPGRMRDEKSISVCGIYIAGKKKFFNNTDVIYLQEISLFKKLVRKKKEQRFFCHEFSNKTEGGIV